MQATLAYIKKTTFWASENAFLKQFIHRRNVLNCKMSEW